MRSAEDKTVYFAFIEYFVSAVIGRKRYKQNRCDNHLSKYVTPSDEALAIILFDNNIDTWMDQAKHNLTKSGEVKPKYTNGGSSKGEVASSRKYQGWSEEGLKKFNELHGMIKRDRASPHARQFEEDFRQHCESVVAAAKPKLPEYQHDVIEICHDLWSDDEEDDSKRTFGDYAGSQTSYYNIPQKKNKQNDGSSVSINMKLMRMTLKKMVRMMRMRLKKMKMKKLRPSVPFPMKSECKWLLYVIVFSKHKLTNVMFLLQVCLSLQMMCC